MAELTSTTGGAAADVTSTATTGDPITPQIFQEMLNVLDDLVNHTHIFYDDYGSACNCNCNCQCTRGSL